MNIRELITELEWIANDHGDEVQIVSNNDWPISYVQVIEANERFYVMMHEG